MTTTDTEKQVRAERERCRQLFLEHLLHAHGPILGDPGVSESVKHALEAIETGAPTTQKLEFVEGESIRELPSIRRMSYPAGKTASTEDILTAMADAVSPIPPPILAPRCGLCEAPVLPREDGLAYSCDCQYWSLAAYQRLLNNRLAEQRKGGQ